MATSRPAAPTRPPGIRCVPPYPAAAGLVTLLLLEFVDMAVGRRVSRAQELEGLGKALHGVTLWLQRHHPTIF
jgi:ammonia channel protein AmtB